MSRIIGALDYKDTIRDLEDRQLLFLRYDQCWAIEIQYFLNLRRGTAELTKVIFMCQEYNIEQNDKPSSRGLKVSKLR